MKTELLELDHGLVVEKVRIAVPYVGLEWSFLAS